MINRVRARHPFVNGIVWLIFKQFLPGFRAGFPFWNKGLHGYTGTNFYLRARIVNLLTVSTDPSVFLFTTLFLFLRVKVAKIGLVDKTQLS